MAGVYQLAEFVEGGILTAAGSPHAFAIAIGHQRDVRVQWSQTTAAGAATITVATSGLRLDDPRLASQVPSSIPGNGFWVTEASYGAADPDGVITGAADTLSDNAAQSLLVYVDVTVDLTDFYLMISGGKRPRP